MIHIKKSKEDDTIDFSFINTSNNEIVGHLKSDINKKDKTAFIHSTYLFPEYRGRGILKGSINDILCGIKNEGVNKATLIASEYEAGIWRKFGFKVRSNVPNIVMERDISNMECK